MSANRVRLQVEPVGGGKQLVRVSMGPSVVYSRRTRAEFSVEEVFAFLDRLQVTAPDEIQGATSKWVKKAEAKNGGNGKR